MVFTVLPLLTDVLLTLLVRARRRAPLSQPHREHLYQLWLQAGWGSHASLALRVWALGALCTAVGLWFELYARDWAPIGFAVTVAVLSLSWVLARRKLSSLLSSPASSSSGGAER